MITFLGYRFEVTRIQDVVRFEALDPDTPKDVIEALLKTHAMNELCYLKRFGAASCSAPATSPDPSTP